MRRLAFLLLLALLSGCAQGAAETADYAQYLPEGARYVKEEPEGGGTEIAYEGADGVKYRLLVDASGAVRALETHRKRPDGNYTSSLLGEYGAFEIVRTRFPDAELRSASLRTDDGDQVCVMIFASGDSLYAYEMAANDGYALDSTRFFGYTKDADPTAQILLSYPAAEITRLELDFERGVAVYKGEATVEGIGYDFEVDFATGQLLEWDMDD